MSGKFWAELKCKIGHPLNASTYIRSIFTTKNAKKPTLRGCKLRL